MSMLAERKRKTKWVINPSKTPLWTQESSGIKFGKELMEKMGWSAGKGLGLKEQGIEEPLRVSYKQDTKGMGFIGNEDDWIEYQDKFNMLLSQLSTNNGTGVVENLEPNKPKVKSLELKSKHSKARVHYKKFTRGKDLSNYSENDLACILGTNKATKEKSKSEVVNKTTGKSEYETSFGVTTINSGSIEDYFKKKKTFDKIKCSNSFITAEVTENLSENFSDTKSIDDTKTLFEENDQETCVQEKKHKRKKHKSGIPYIYETTENLDKISADEHLSFPQTEHESEKWKHKKRKKSKSKDESSETNENEECEVTEMEIIKKVKKKKKKKMVETNLEEKKIKKKKKKDDESDNLSENKNQMSDELEESNPSPEDESFPLILKEKNIESKNEKKKSKHGKRKMTLEVDEIPVESTQNPVGSEEFTLAKVKKSKKRKHESDPEEEEVEVVHTANRNTSSEMQETTENNEFTGEAEEKHKSKKKRRNSIETKNDIPVEEVKINESNSKILNANAEKTNGAADGKELPKEHKYTSEKVLDLIRWADIKEFRGSNLGKVLGYGFKREYLRHKMGGH